MFLYLFIYVNIKWNKGNNNHKEQFHESKNENKQEWHVQGYKGFYLSMMLRYLKKQNISACKHVSLLKNTSIGPAVMQYVLLYT